jgi:hypothetical protein
VSNFSYSKFKQLQEDSFITVIFSAFHPLAIHSLDNKKVVTTATIEVAKVVFSLLKSPIQFPL